jgi:LmbE family N-acetylglucosaminyl deacetylase/uncharacterized OsmC-like protein
MTEQHTVEDTVEDTVVEVVLDLEEGYRFRVGFEPAAGSLVMDEPAPLGQGAGPNAARVLAAAVGNCLSASLLFCLRKARVDVRAVRTVARALLVRNERGRLRVGEVRVSIQPEIAGDTSRVGRCLELFEDYCVVTDSVRHGLPVSVAVSPRASGDQAAGPGGAPRRGGLPRASSVLAVCAHPDDESFGLGAVLDAFTRAGARVSVLSLTQGEAGRATGTTAGDLGEIRAAELRSAAETLGLERVDALGYPDGASASVPLQELASSVARAAADAAAELLLVFDEGGITGHPDHRRATQAAVVAARDAGLPVLAWALPREAAETLNGEFGAAFVGRDPRRLDVELDVDRSRQWRAISRYTSQAGQFPVVARRLELLGSREHLRWLLRPGQDPATREPEVPASAPLAPGNHGAGRVRA